MRTEQLVYLEAVLRHGSLRAASRALGVSQPTLSDQIRRLEEDMNVVLLSRSRSGVIPTPAVQILRPRIMRLIEDERLLREESKALSTLHSGVVRVGTTSMLSKTLVTPVVAHYRASHPNVRFDVSEVGSQFITERVLNWDLDVGLIARVSNEPVDENLVARPLLINHLVVCLPRGHSHAGLPEINFGDLAREQWIVQGREYTLRRVLEQLSATSTPNISYMAQDTSAALHMVAAGVGIALSVPLALSTIDAADRDRIVAVPLAGKQLPHIVSALIRRRDALPSQASAEIMRLIMQALEKLDSVQDLRIPSAAPNRVGRGQSTAQHSRSVRPITPHGLTA